MDGGSICKHQFWQPPASGSLAHVEQRKISGFFCLAQSVFKLQNSHLHPNWSEFRQDSNAIFITSPACFVWKRRQFFASGVSTDVELRQAKTDRRHYFEGAWKDKRSQKQGEPSEVVFHQRLSSVKGRLPWRSSSTRMNTTSNIETTSKTKTTSKRWTETVVLNIKVRPSSIKAIFRQRSSSIKGHLPSNKIQQTAQVSNNVLIEPHDHA